MKRRRTEVDDAGAKVSVGRLGRLGRLGRPVLAGLSIFGIFVTWSLATARYGGPDEPAHVLRAASVASGDLLGRPAPGLDPGYRAVRVPAALTTGDPSCYRHDDHTPATCGVADSDATGSARAASSAGTYPPLYYALIGVPVRLLGDTSDVLWYRVVAAFWCALVLTIAMIRSQRFGASLLIACLTPAAWFLFGVVNPNALEIALAILAWVGVARIRTLPRLPTRSDVRWVAAPMAVAILIRPVAAMAWVAMAGVLVLSVDRRPKSSWSAAPRRWLSLGLPAAAIIATIGWNAWAGVDFSDSRTAERLPVLRSLWRAVEDSPETWREMAGSLGWLEFSSPWISHVVWWSIAGVAAWLALRHSRSLRRAWLWVLVVLVVGPVAFEVVFARSVGFIWQGRYSIATGLGLVIVGLDASRTRLSPRQISGIVAMASAAQVATLWVVLQRYTVGADGSWWFRESKWNPPVPPLVLVGANVMLISLLWLANHTNRANVGDGLGAMGDRGCTVAASGAPASSRREGAAKGAPGAGGQSLPTSVACGHLSTDDVEGRAGTEPLDLLGAERVDAFEVDR